MPPSPPRRDWTLAAGHPPLVPDEAGQVIDHSCLHYLFTTEKLNGQHYFHSRRISPSCAEIVRSPLTLHGRHSAGCLGLCSICVRCDPLEAGKQATYRAQYGPYRTCHHHHHHHRISYQLSPSSCIFAVCTQTQSPAVTPQQGWILLDCFTRPKPACAAILHPQQEHEPVRTACLDP